MCRLCSIVLNLQIQQVGVLSDSFEVPVNRHVIQNETRTPDDKMFGQN